MKKSNLIEFSKSKQNKKIQIHSAKLKKKVTFNAMGTKFQITKHVFEQISCQSRLGILKGFETMSSKEILSYCDDFDPVAVEFFFNRDPEILKIVLNFCLTGELHLNTHFCEVYLNDELDYWQIDNNSINHCCVNTFEENYENKTAIMKAEKHMIQKWELRHNKKANLREKLWKIFNNPRNSPYAMVSQLY